MAPTPTCTARGILPGGLLSRLAPERALLRYEDIGAVRCRGSEVQLALRCGERRDLSCSDGLAAEALAAEIDAVLHPARTVLASIDGLGELRKAIRRELQQPAWLASGIWELIFLAATRLGVQDLRLETQAGASARLVARREGLLHPIAELAAPIATRLREGLGAESNGDLLGATLRLAGGHRSRFRGWLNVVAGRRGDDLLVSLEASQRIRELESLGFAGPPLSKLQRAAGLSEGLIAISGPPQSGTSTTLRALLQRILRNNEGGRLRAITLDPPGQRPTPQTFLSGPCRSSVLGGPPKVVSLNRPRSLSLADARSARAWATQYVLDARRDQSHRAALDEIVDDYDIIAGVDLHDADTVDLALEASLAGRLVLGTLRASTLTEAMLRLRDLDGRQRLEEGLAAVICQRLERRGCDLCDGRGCTVCDDTGFAGLRARGAVFLGGASSASPAPPPPPESAGEHPAPILVGNL